MKRGFTMYINLECMGAEQFGIGKCKGKFKIWKPVVLRYFLFSPIFNLLIK